MRIILRLVGNIADETLSDARSGIQVYQLARVLHTVAFSVLEVFIREAGWPELNREFMLSFVNWVTSENCFHAVPLLYDTIPSYSVIAITKLKRKNVSDKRYNVE